MLIAKFWNKRTTTTMTTITMTTQYSILACELNKSSNRYYALYSVHIVAFLRVYVHGT